MFDLQVVRLGVQILVSLVILSASLYIIISRGYDEPSAKWAFSMIGLLVGYWLR